MKFSIIIASEKYLHNVSARIPMPLYECSLTTKLFFNSDLRQRAILQATLEVNQNAAIHFPLYQREYFSTQPFGSDYVDDAHTSNDIIIIII